MRVDQRTACYDRPCRYDIAWHEQEVHGLARELLWYGDDADTRTASAEHRGTVLDLVRPCFREYVLMKKHLGYSPNLLGALRMASEAASAVSPRWTVIRTIPAESASPLKRRRQRYARIAFSEKRPEMARSRGAASRDRRSRRPADGPVEISLRAASLPVKRFTMNADLQPATRNSGTAAWPDRMLSSPMRQNLHYCVPGKLANDQ